MSVHYQPKNFRNSMAQFFARLDWRPIVAPSLLGLKSTLPAQYKATALIVPSSSSKSNLNSCVARNSSGPPKYSATVRHGGEYATSSPSHLHDHER